MKTLAVCSGGLDSVTLAYTLKSQGKLAAVLSFDYGQRHKKELQFSQDCANNLAVPYFHLPLPGLAALLPGSALTDEKNVEVPHGHYAAKNMNITIVPNRNAIFLSLAFGLAAAHGFNSVAAAFHGGDHFIYPDCRPEFVDAFSQMQQKSLDGFEAISLDTPFLNLSKADIVSQGAMHNVPFNETWSCYEGKNLHCGQCGTCVERQEAFSEAKVLDPTEYANAQFWKMAVREHKEGLKDRDR